MGELVDKFKRPAKLRRCEDCSLKNQTAPALKINWLISKTGGIIKA